MNSFRFFPGIKAVALGIAYDNGQINRTTDQEAWLDAAADPINQAGTLELLQLDLWLQDLSQDHIQLLAAGEESDMTELQNRSPDPVFCKFIFNAIAEAS